MKRYHIVILNVFFIFLTGCGRTAPPIDTTKIMIFTGIPPIQYVTERICGSTMIVQSLLKPGDNPHIYDPTPSQVKLLYDSKLLITTGLPFEERLTDILNKTNAPEIINLSQRLGIEQSAPHDHETEQDDHHKYGHEHEHHHDIDLHIWLSPLIVQKMAGIITEELIRLNPSDTELYRKNRDILLKELDATHHKIEKMLAPFQDSSFYVYHPAYGHFAQTYGLKQQAIEIEGKEPTPRELNNIIKEARAHTISVIFVQPQFDARSAQKVAQAIGATVVNADPLNKDIFATYLDMAEKLSSALHPIDTKTLRGAGE